jgi:diguanylate cyclase (GGDEF)-like protein
VGERPVSVRVSPTVARAFLDALAGIDQLVDGLKEVGALPARTATPDEVAPMLTAFGEVCQVAAAADADQQLVLPSALDLARFVLQGNAALTWIDRIASNEGVQLEHRDQHDEVRGGFRTWHSAPTGGFGPYGSAAPDQLFALDASGWVVDANDAAESCCPSAIGSPVFDMLDHAEDVLRLADVAIAGNGEALVTVSGNRVAVRVAGQFGPDSMGAWIASVRDVSHQDLAVEELSLQAGTDFLTGLANRRTLITRLEEALTREVAIPFALLLIDLDGFKVVNDVHGHAAGDAVLCEVADRLRDLLTPNDLAARLAGDEFVLLIDDTRAPGRHPSALTATLEARLAARLIPGLVPGGIAIRASVGAAEHAPDDTVDTMLERADRAMYLRKAGS